MISMKLRLAAIAAAALVPATSLADSKEECLDAHSRGQDAREQGKLTLARKLFMTCAQSSCPALVQGDCARFADDLGRSQPSLAFVSRDGGGLDLPDTTVYVDNVLVANRLDDGKPHDVDPGRHTVRFTHNGVDQSFTIVVGTGEKGRAVIATFKGGGDAGAVTEKAEPGKPAAPAVKRPGGARIAMIGGGALAAGGLGLAVVGLLKVPSNCSVSSHECAAPPGDKAFDDASSGVKLFNIGLITGAVGVAALTAGVVWYMKSGKPSAERSVVATPWLSPDGGGFAVSGRL